MLHHSFDFIISSIYLPYINYMIISIYMIFASATAFKATYK